MIKAACVQSILMDQGRQQFSQLGQVFATLLSLLDVALEPGGADR